MIEKKEHKFAWVLRAIADGESPNDFEVHRNNCGDVSELSHNEYALLRSIGIDWTIKRKVKMHQLGGVRFPAPMTEAPKEGGFYWVAASTGTLHSAWSGNNKSCKEWLAMGICHTTREAAVAHQLALQAIARGTPV